MSPPLTHVVVLSCVSACWCVSFERGKDVLDISSELADEWLVADWVGLSWPLNPHLSLQAANSTNAHLSLPGANSPNLTITHDGPEQSADDEIVGAECSAPSAPGGTSWPLILIGGIVACLLVLDRTTFCSECLDSLPWRRGRGLAPDLHEHTKNDGESIKEVQPLSDDAPVTIDWSSYLLIACTVVPAVVGDLYFAMLAPFLPGVVDIRGMSCSISGLSARRPTWFARVCPDVLR